MGQATEITVDKARGFIAARLVGLQTRETLESAFEAMTKHPEFEPSMNRLWDARDAELHKLSSGEMRLIQRFMLGRPDAASAVQVALLVARLVDFGVGNMFTMLSEGKLPAHIRAFQDREEAEAWVTKSRNGSS